MTREARVFLELRWDSRVTTGNSGFLLCWPRKSNLPPPLGVGRGARPGPLSSGSVDAPHWGLRVTKGPAGTSLLCHCRNKDTENSLFHKRVLSTQSVRTRQGPRFRGAVGSEAAWLPQGAHIPFSSVHFSRSVVSDLRPHELQHAWPPCPSPTPGVYPNSCPLSR